MTDTYKGESPGKKIARALHWEHMKDCIGPAFATGTHVVLGSREGGDIGCLRAMGLPWTRIVAVERNPVAHDALRAKWPEARVVLGDVADVCCHISKKEKIVSAFLDFCSPICDTTIRTTSKVVQRALGEGSFLSIGLLRGREQQAFKLMPWNERLKWMASRLEREPSLRARVPKSTLGGHALYLKGDRAFAVAERLNEAGLPMRWFLSQVAKIDYHSRTRTNRGVPMTISTFEIVRERVSVSTAAFVRRLGLRHERNALRNMVVSVPAHDADVEVRRLALDAIANGESVEWAALSLNLAPETIVAWKAHATRGTYDREDAAE